MPEPIAAFPSGSDPRFWKYDWAAWSDGQVWKFTRDELESVYATKAQTFINSARRAARERGKRVRASRVDGGAIIQFIDPSEGRYQRQKAAQDNAGSSPHSPQHPHDSLTA
jgi:hypothetical protein